LSASATATRIAQLSDAPVVQDISAEAYVPAYQAIIGAAPKPAYEDYTDRIKRGEVWILDLVDGPSGVTVLEPTDDYLLIYSIAVRPQYQGRGYGKLLLAFAEQQAAARGLAEVRLYTNRRMEQNLIFYRNFGYSEMGTRPHPHRSEEIVVDMVKPIAAKASFDVRRIKPDDQAEWLPMWHAFFAFHGRKIPDVVTKTTFGRLCDPVQPMHAFVADGRSGLVGFVTFIFHLDTVTVGPVCYLKNLFTRADARGQGIGRALIQAVYEAAEQAGAERVTWLVQEGNTAAMRLYDQLATRTGFVQYRKDLG